jgi:hypothetical protein
MSCPLPTQIAVPNLARILLLAALALASAGCNPAAKLIGQWEVDTTQLQAKLGETKGNPLGGMGASMLAMFDFSIEFKSDGTCSAKVSILGQSNTVAGKWRFVKQDGDALVIAIKMDDKPDEREVRVRFSDNDHLEMEPPVSTGPAGEGKTLTFVRVKPK